jgi:hypothetical protein
VKLLTLPYKSFRLQLWIVFGKIMAMVGPEEEPGRQLTLRYVPLTD